MCVMQAKIGVIHRYEFNVAIGLEICICAYVCLINVSQLKANLSGFYISLKIRFFWVTNLSDSSWWVCGS